MLRNIVASICFDLKLQKDKTFNITQFTLNNKNQLDKTFKFETFLLNRFVFKALLTNFEKINFVWLFLYA